MVYFSLVFDYGNNKLRRYIGENSIVFPLINNSYVEFENVSEQFRSGSKIPSSSSSSSIFWYILISRLSWKCIFRDILISRFFELNRETAKFSCNKVVNSKIQQATYVLW